MSLIAFEPHVGSVTEAAARGLTKHVREAEMGEDLAVERRYKALGRASHTVPLAESIVVLGKLAHG
jgi:hypothetical protein